MVDWAKGSGSQWEDEFGDPNIKVGVEVIIGKHRTCEGTRAWTLEHEPYCGQRARVIATCYEGTPSSNIRWLTTDANEQLLFRVRDCTLVTPELDRAIAYWNQRTAQEDLPENGTQYMSVVTIALCLREDCGLSFLQVNRVIAQMSMMEALEETSSGVFVPNLQRLSALAVASPVEEVKETVQPPPSLDVVRQALYAELSPRVEALEETVRETFLKAVQEGSGGVKGLYAELEKAEAQSAVLSRERNRNEKVKADCDVHHQWLKLVFETSRLFGPRPLEVYRAIVMEDMASYRERPPEATQFLETELQLVQEGLSRPWERQQEWAYALDRRGILNHMHDVEWKNSFRLVKDERTLGAQQEQLSRLVVLAGEGSSQTLLKEQGKKTVAEAEETAKELQDFFLEWLARPLGSAGE